MTDVPTEEKKICR